jgi:putative salt-induced outer membrane protein
MRATAIFGLLTILLLGLPAAADQVTLTNGDRLTGTVTDYDGTQFRMKTALVGTVRIPWDAVEQLATETPLAVTLADGTVLEGTLTLCEDEVVIRTPDGLLATEREKVLTVRTPQAQAAYEARLRPGLHEAWQGNFDTGLSSTRGNSDTVTFAVGFGAERQTLNDKLITYFNSLFTRDKTSEPSQTIANTLRYGGRYERNVNTNFFSFGFTDLESDAVQALDLRWVLGGGLGWRLYRTPRMQMEVFAGGSLNQEYFQGEPVRRTGEVLIGEEVSYQLSRRTTFKERLSFFPNVNEAGEYRITFDSTAVHKLSNWLSWQATLSNRFLSNPPPGREKNDLLFTTGVRLTFGAPAQ